MSNILANVELYYPSAREWMWDYCIYLGPFTSSTGDNYDLGAFNTGDGDYTNATVYGDTPGNYISGGLEMFNPEKDNELYNEVEKRLKALGLLK
jgi:hypothetical protein